MHVLFFVNNHDPMTTLDCVNALKQEGWMKAIERAFGVWKKKFLLVGMRIILHKHEDIFYLVPVTIGMHNMMVEERRKNW